MPRVRLIHWNAAEGRARAAMLRGHGYTVDVRSVTPASVRTLKANPPSAVVIDLSRLPMQGRDVGVALRHARSTRRVPLVFVGGDPEKVRRVKALLPDAAFTDWRGIRGAVKRALASGPSEAAAPTSVLAGYANTPLPKKLGIREGSTVLLVSAPRAFAATLGRLPAGATLRRRPSARRDLTIWFVRSRAALTSRIQRVIAQLGPGGLWIAWPKQASGAGSDLTQAEVRRAGLAHGLVDFKVCAIDETWSGLRFARRRRSRAVGHGDTPT